MLNMFIMYVTYCGNVKISCLLSQDDMKRSQLLFVYMRVEALIPVRLSLAPLTHFENFSQQERHVHSSSIMLFLFVKHTPFK